MPDRWMIRIPWRTAQRAGSKLNTSASVYDEFPILWESTIPLLAEEGWMRRAKRRRRRGGQFGEVVAGLLLRLRASLEAARYRACASRGLALRATPARQLLLSCRASPPLRGGE